MRPTRIGPAMMFNSVIGFPDVRVLVGLTASRERVGILFDSPPNRLTQRMAEAYRDAIAPVKFSGDKAPCQQVVHRADEPGFDLRTILPAPTNTDRDAGPFFCLGLVLGSDPELGTDVTIHRLCVQGRDEMSIFFAPPAYRRFPGTCRGGRTAVPHLGQHGPRPGDPRQRRIRGPDHPDGLRRAGDRRRDAGHARRAGRLRLRGPGGDRRGRDRHRGLHHPRQARRRRPEHRHGLGHAGVPRLRRPR